MSCCPFLSHAHLTHTRTFPLTVIPCSLACPTSLPLVCASSLCSPPLPSSASFSLARSLPASSFSLSLACSLVRGRSLSLSLSSTLYLSLSHRIHHPHANPPSRFTVFFLRPCRAAFVFPGANAQLTQPLRSPHKWNLAKIRGLRGGGQDSEMSLSGYLTPVQEMVDLVDAKPSPSMSVQPSSAGAHWVLMLQPSAMLELEDLAQEELKLAGTRLLAQFGTPSRRIGYKTIRLLHRASRQEYDIGMPPYMILLCPTRDVSMRHAPSRRWCAPLRMRISKTPTPLKIQIFCWSSHTFNTLFCCVFLVLSKLVPPSKHPDLQFWSQLVLAGRVYTD